MPCRAGAAQSVPFCRCASDSGHAGIHLLGAAHHSGCPAHAVVQHIAPHLPRDRDSAGSGPPLRISALLQLNHPLLLLGEGALMWHAASRCAGSNHSLYCSASVCSQGTWPVAVSILHRRRAYASLGCMQALVQQGDRAKLDYVAALAKVPRGLRTMYVHAVQSWLWNRAAAARCAQHGCSSAVAGDLVLPQSQAPLEETSRDDQG